MSNIEILRSKEDSSVNFIIKDNKVGFQEARYVRRSPKYAVVYLSSQTGCNQGCRFCHLTTTGQTQLVDLSVDEMIDQADIVLKWYDDNAPKAELVHFNWMSKGEALANTYLKTESFGLFSKLHHLAKERNLKPKFLISTIMPREILDEHLIDMFPVYYPTIYYSIYSTKTEFRRKWLPKALPVDIALTKLKDYQRISGKVIKLHWAFIKDENDSIEDIENIISAVLQHKLNVDINIVRYNPFSDRYGQETELSTIEAHVTRLRNALPTSTIKIIDRVGVDVKASCGTFLT